MQVQNAQSLNKTVASQSKFRAYKIIEENNIKAIKPSVDTQK